MIKVSDIDTPALIVNHDIMMKNIMDMQKKANDAGVNLRPHTKTHRTPEIAKLQLAAGARGITVAKLGEAEVMGDNGIKDIFIANEIVGDEKLKRLKALASKVNVGVGVDCEEHVKALSKAFEGEEKPIEVLIELEIGEVRTGVTSLEELLSLAEKITNTPNVTLKGIFAHEGHTYRCETREKCVEESIKSQEYILKGVKLLKDSGIDIEVVSIGSTPSMMNGIIMDGITEIRPGTYVFMDVAQSNGIGSFERCAASVISTVISKPTDERVVLDAGVKALTCHTSNVGICKALGYGNVKGFENLAIQKLYDEHGIINSREASKVLQIGDKVEIIPNHICPVCNLYNKMYIVKDGFVVNEYPILCQGKSQ